MNGKVLASGYYDVNIRSYIILKFSGAISRTSVNGNITIKDQQGKLVPVSFNFENGDSIISIKTNPLTFLNRYTVSISSSVQSTEQVNFDSEKDFIFATSIDSSRKFPLITDSALLDTVQKRTFKYFWDYAHPVSGLARERSNATPEIVTTGGSGFGIMALIVGIERGFITKAQGLARLQTIVAFLKNKASEFHGAFPHWMNGSTGAVIPFSTDDNGADLVETSYLMMGLLTARQYFTGTGASETALRNDINSLWNGVEWNWFRQNNQDVLYWHWSPTANWAINQKIRGWNECLITYVLAASSSTHAITKDVYDKGWAGDGAIKNGNDYFGYRLPLGTDFGGPLFFEQYSFMGINPVKLSDRYADYQLQTKNHTLINYTYCRTNPKNYFGYSDSVWGLTASDIKGGYTASSPTNDQGFIAPTAAISSIAYAPAQSMAALKFYYYVLGDRLFKEYGFTDAFSLDVIKNNGAWFADSYLAIDQGPIIVMIENYRTKLLWNLFMSCPEVQNGLGKLGFSGF
ncbi:glucoamylase family protein [Niabella ginsenosidivorans]|nr:glucoamylase family protein [Niabella ginsenosidivorans]